MCCWACEYLFLLWLKLVHVSKTGIANVQFHYNSLGAPAKRSQASRGWHDLKTLLSKFYCDNQIS